MYFKIERGTKTFTDHQRVWDKIKRCNSDALKLVEEMGFTKFCRSQSHIGGGISAVEYLNCKPDGYKSVGKSYQNLYYPKVKNKELIKKIDSLPTVSFEEFNESIGFKAQSQGMSHYRSFGSKRVGDVYLISMYDECEYDPKPDMIEILPSEYKELTK